MNFVDMKRRLDAQPFNCLGDECTDARNFLVFPKGVLVGKRNSVCNYGDEILYVESKVMNCPSGESSVTLGYYKSARGYYSVVSSGYYNKANSYFPSVSGGVFNNASGQYASVAGGQTNTASGNFSFAVGGNGNLAGTEHSYKFGVINNKVINTQSSIHTGELDISEESFQRTNIIIPQKQTFPFLRIDNRST